MASHSQYRSLMKQFLLETMKAEKYSEQAFVGKEKTAGYSTSNRVMKRSRLFTIPTLLKLLKMQLIGRHLFTELK